MVSNEILHSILQSVHNGIIAIDEKGLISFFNQAALSLLGLQENIKAQPINKIIPNTELLDILNTGRSHFGMKFEYNEKKFLANRTPIQINGNISGAVAVIQEITDLEQISSDLATVKELNKELNAIIDALDDGLLVLNRDGKVTRINKSLTRVTGIDTNKFLNRELKTLYEEGLLLHEPVAVEALNKNEVIKKIQDLNTGKQVIITATPISDINGNTKAVASTVRDVTELNRLKQELENTQKLTDYYKTKLDQLSKIQLDNNEFITRNPKTLNILQFVQKVAQTDSAVLILGESGVGKELIAENIHNWNWDDSKGELIKINCGSIPKDLLEAELFGYESGSFTGANKKGKSGLFELANGGTIFLDEIGDLPLEMQAKLLRVLEDKKMLKLGGIKPVNVEARFIAATNQNLEKKVEEGTFRKDLYYRINALPIVIPPLRERTEDIPLLLSHFLHYFNNKYGFHKSFTPEAVNILQLYKWPGNVRELKNTVERMAIISNENTIKEKDIPDYITETLNINANFSLSEKPLNKIKEEIEIEVLKNAINKYNSMRKVAQEIGLSHTATIKKARKYNLI